MYIKENGIIIWDFTNISMQIHVFKSKFINFSDKIQNYIIKRYRYIQVNTEFNSCILSNIKICKYTVVWDPLHISLHPIKPYLWVLLMNSTFSMMDCLMRLDDFQ